MDDITKEMIRILNHINDNNWISFTKDDSKDTFRAREQLRAFGLIEKYNQYSYRLTKEGYVAVKKQEKDLLKSLKEPTKTSRKIRQFLIKFWWAVIIPILVGVVILAIGYGWFAKD